MGRTSNIARLLWVWLLLPVAAAPLAIRGQGAPDPREISPEPRDNAAGQAERLANHLAATARLKEYGRPNLAERRLRAALLEAPTSPLLLHALGELQLRGGLFKPSEAGDTYDKLLSLKETDAAAHLGKGESAFLLAGRIRTHGATEEDGLTREARTHLKRALELDTKLARAAFLLGEIERLNALAMRDDEPGATARRERALVTAREWYLKALAQDPSHIDTLYSIAATEIKLKLARQALEHLAALSIVQGDSLATWEMKAQAALLQSPPDLTLYQKSCSGVLKEYPTTQAQISASLAERLTTLNDTALAIEVVCAAQDAIALAGSTRAQRLAPYLPRKLKEGDARERPVVPELCYLAAAALFESAVAQADETTRIRLLEQVLEVIAPAIDIENTVPDAARIRALTNTRLLRFMEAKDAFEKLAKLDKDDPVAEVYATVMPDLAAGHITLPLFEQLLDLRDAEIAQQQRVTLLKGLAAQAPKFALAQGDLATLLFRERNFDEARAHFEAALAVHPEAKAFRFGLARALGLLGRWKDARDELAKLDGAKDEPSDLRYWKDVASRITSERLAHDAFILYHDSLHPSLAPRERKGKLDAALKVTPDFFEALLDRAALASRDGEHDRSLELARAALKAAGNDDERSNAHVRIADSLRAGGKPADAVEQYEAAARYEHSDNERRGSLCWLQAYAAFQAGNHKAADGLLRDALNGGLPMASYEASKHAIEFLTDYRPATERTVLAVTPVVTKGERLKFRAGISLARTGGALLADHGAATSGNDRTATTEFTVTTDVEAVPGSGGLWELKIGFTDLPENADYKTLADLTLHLRISPWFGLVAQPIKQDAPGYLASLPVVQAVTEIFTIARGTADARQPFLWSNPLSAGAVHLEAENEACYVAQYGTDAIVLKRLAVDDFIDPAMPDVRRRPDKRVDTTVTLEGASRLPRGVELQVIRSTLDESLPDIVTNVMSVVMQRTN